MQANVAEGGGKIGFANDYFSNFFFLSFFFFGNIIIIFVWICVSIFRDAVIDS